jgi:hypothetical protein
MTTRKITDPAEVAEIENAKLETKRRSDAYYVGRERVGEMAKNERRFSLKTDDGAVALSVLVSLVDNAGNLQREELNKLDAHDEPVAMLTEEEVSAMEKLLDTAPVVDKGTDPAMVCREADSFRKDKR